MEREYGLEGGTRSLEERIKPRVYVIAGTSDSGKVDLALDLINKFPNFKYVDVPNPAEYALGPLTDYRAEIYHALQRYLIFGEHWKKGHNIIVCHSLIDSLAWMSYNVQRRIMEGIGNNFQVEAFATVMLAQIVLDSFYADHVFLIDDPKDEEDEEVYDKMLETVQSFIVPYTVLDNEPSSRVEECARIILDNE
jgi:hypothetical protein